MADKRISRREFLNRTAAGVGLGLHALPAPTEVKAAGVVAPIAVIKPAVALATVFPDPPTQRPVMDRGVLLQDSPYFWSDPAGKRGAKPPYQALEDGFTTRNGASNCLEAGRAHHWLSFENNQIHVGDRPLVSVQLTAFCQMYGNHGTFPITGVGMEETLSQGTAVLSLGWFRFAVEAQDKAVWLDTFPEIEVVYRAGLAQWRCRDSELGVALTLEIRPNIRARGFIARIRVEQAPADARLLAFGGALGFHKLPYANFSYDPGGGKEAPNPPNRIDLRGASARITSPRLSRALAFFGGSHPETRAVYAPENVFDVANEAITPQFDPHAKRQRPCACITTPLAAGQTFFCLSVWGADGYDTAKAEEIKRLLNPEALPQTAYDRIWNLWFENFIGRQLEPERKFNALLADPGRAWADAEGFWAERARRWDMKTPSPALNAVGSWAGQTLEYFRQPPGYMLGQLAWQGYGHITSGWHALGAIGDTGKLAELLGLYAGMRQAPTPRGGDPNKDAGQKEIRWVFLNLDTAVSEPLNAPFLDHVWRWWQWTGDKEGLRALWPAVQDAIAGEKANRDPDGDGLYHGYYEFWDCDDEQRGPKAAGETGWMISGLRAAAKMARILGHEAQAAAYEADAERSYRAFQKQLWYPEVGQCGARAADDQRYERASVQEVFLPAQRDVLSEKQAAQAFRRLHYLYSRTSRYGVPMLFKNDVWPILWSQHYMAPGDICLAYMAAARCGLAEEFHPYLEVIARSALKSYHAGMGLSVGQDGAMDSLEAGNSDCQAPFAWSIAEGLFGIAPDGAPGHVRIAPNLPEAWPEAATTIGDISLRMIRQLTRQSDNRVTLEIRDRKRRQLRIQWPTITPVKAVRLNGKPVAFKRIPAVNRALVEVSLKAERAVTLEYEFEPQPLRLDSIPMQVVADEPLELKAAGGRVVEIDDPQGSLSRSVLHKAGATLWPKGEGFHTLFVRLARGEFAYWAPVSFKSGPAWEIVEEYEAADPPRSAPIKQIWPRLLPAERRLIARLRNRRATRLEGSLSLTVGGQRTSHPVTIAPGETMDIATTIAPETWNRLLPGAIEFAVEGLGRRRTSRVPAWPTEANPASPRFPARERMLALDIDAARNLTPKAMEKAPMPLDFGSRNTLLGWYNTRFDMPPLPEWFEPLPGLPFKLSSTRELKEGEPMLVLAHAGEPPLPNRARFEIGQKIERIYLLVLFAYYTIKTYSPQAEWLLQYADGQTAVVPWIPPFHVDSNLRPDSPWTYPVTVGHSNDPGWNVPSYMLGPIHAQIAELSVDPTRALVSLEARVTSTESYMGLLGITLVKPE